LALSLCLTLCLGATASFCTTLRLQLGLALALSLCLTLSLSAGLLLRQDAAPPARLGAALSLSRSALARCFFSKTLRLQLGLLALLLTLGSDVAA
jgi:hypothetical protein